jgi:hypothetical protein
VGQAGLAQLPLPLALAITLGLLRLVGGALGFRAGYKVGGLIVVMGWLVHSSQLESWIPLRLFWTALGVLALLVGLRLFWPARAVNDSRQQAAALLMAVADQLRQQAGGGGPSSAAQVQGLRARLMALRQWKPLLIEELGLRSQDHPYYRWIEQIEQATSLLVRALDGRRHRPAHPRHGDAQAELLAGLHGAEDALLLAVAERLELWARCCERVAPAAAVGVPPLPPALWEPPPAWQALQARLALPGLEAVPLERLQRLAGRLMLGGQMVRAICAAEAAWKAL